MLPTKRRLLPRLLNRRFKMMLLLLPRPLKSLKTLLTPPSLTRNLPRKLLRVKLRLPSRRRSRPRRSRLRSFQPRHSMPHGVPQLRSGPPTCQRMPLRDMPKEEERMLRSTNSSKIKMKKRPRKRKKSPRTRAPTRMKNETKRPLCRK